MKSDLAEAVLASINELTDKGLMVEVIGCDNAGDNKSFHKMCIENLKKLFV